MYSLLWCLLMINPIAQVLGTGELWLRFISYNNPGGKGANGHCCDGRSIFCQSRGCDHYFKVCFDQSDGSDSVSDCSVGKFSTGSVNDRDRITFGSSIGGTSNPMVTSFTEWPETSKLKVDVWDKDSNSNDLVERLRYEVSYLPASSLSAASGNIFTINGRTKLRLEVKVACDVNWYGSRCNVLCRPQDSSLGHYDCEEGTGNMVCHPGWGNSNCSVEIDECASAPCQNEADCHDVVNGYTCTCADGYTGAHCKTDIDECLIPSPPCLNGATCLDGTANFTCICVGGWSGDLCDVDIDDCAQFPCEHGSTCHDLLNGYQCTCVEGFAGDRCQVNVDECLSQPCRNGGQCLDQLAGYVCICPSGFVGINCEEEIDECASNPCHGHLSECVDQLNGFVCICPLNRTGEQCETELNWCESFPCFNNATCESFHYMFTCTCPSGWTGALCNVEIDECSSEPCHHNQTCVDLVDGYVCNCSSSYNGSNCQYDVNECDLGYCQNNATCNNTFGSYSCMCTEDWTGQDCETMVDYCQSLPCQNNATCVPSVGGVNCHCQLGWYGPHCELNIDDCSSHPCQNGSTCHDLIGGYYCACPLGWSGENCSSEVDECLADPCLHDGTCVDLLGSYRCVCSDGFTGPSCETRHSCWSSPCQNGGSCVEVGTPPDTIKQNSTGLNYTDSAGCGNQSDGSQICSPYTCQCVAGTKGKTCWDVIYVSNNGTLVFPGYKQDEFEHSALLLERTLADDEAESMVMKLKKPLAYYMDIPMEELAIGHDNEQCMDYNETEIGVLLFWVEVKGVMLPWSLVDRALEQLGDNEDFEQFLGVPLYTGDGCASISRSSTMSSSSWLQKNWVVTVVALLLVATIISITICVIKRHRNKKKDQVRLTGLNPLYDFERRVTRSSSVDNILDNPFYQNGSLYSADDAGNPVYQEISQPVYEETDISTSEQRPSENPLA